MIRVLVVDDQQLIREGLSSILSLEEDIDVVGTAGNGSEAIRMVDDLEPDVVLMDMRMPVCDGLEATREILKNNPRAKILVLTTFEEDELVVKSIKLGAHGYLLKNVPPDQLAKAIRGVKDGVAQFDSSIMPKLVQHLAQPGGQQKKKETTKAFSERELEILKLLGQGKSNKEIAEALHITEGTVKNHVTRVLSILGLRDRTQAALWVAENLQQ